MNTKQQLLMFVGTIALWVFLIGVILTPPASSYESSIYGAYPSFAWIGFVISMCCFITTLTTPSYRRQAVIGLCGLYIMLLTLPTQRGYVLFASPQSDVLYHLGIIRDVVTDGLLPTDFYPAAHAFFGTIKLVSGLPLEALQPISAVLFTFLLIVGIVVSGKRHLGHQSRPWLAVAAVPLVYTIHHVSFQPWFFALTLVPLAVLFVPWYGSVRSARFVVVATLVSIAIVLYHPVTGLFLVGLVLLAWCWSEIGAEKMRSQSQVRITLINIVVVIVIFWLFNSDRFVLILSRFLTGTIADEGVITYTDRAGKTEYTGWELIWEFLVLEWGTILLYMFLGGIVGSCLLLASVRRRHLTPPLLVTGWAALGVTYGISFAVVDSFARNPVRITQFGLLFAIYLVGIALWWTIDRQQTDVVDRSFGPISSSQSDISSRIGTTLVVIIICTSLLGAFTIYPADNHLTERTVEGTGWHLDHHDRSDPTIAQRMRVTMEVYHHGYVGARTQEPVFSPDGPEFRPHLGYEDNERIHSWAGDAYIITKQRDIELEPADREQLKTDPSGNRLYDNGAYQVWQTYDEENSTNSHISTLSLE